MKNVTITLPDEVARRARIFAAERNTSVSRYVGELLAEKLEQEAGYRAAMERWLARAPVALNADAAPYPSRDDVHERLR